VKTGENLFAGPTTESIPAKLNNPPSEQQEDPMTDLNRKKILLTGAAGGFGVEFTRQLLAKGADLILSDIDTNRLKPNMPLAGPGRIIHCTGADLSSFQGCETLVSDVKNTVGDIDILINNAGMLTYGNFHDAPAESLYKLMQVNAVAPMHLTSLFLPDMLKRRKGHIVFLSSVAGFVPTSFETAYSVSKFAVRGFGMALKGEVAKSGVSVTSIYPFWADTNILNSPSYGSKRAKRVPSLFIDSPVKIVAEAIRGIERDKLHVYPGFFAKATWWATKLWPIIGSQPVQDSP
jgi:short-subunit dehydrogenase